MPVTDDEVAALRALLVQDWDAHQRSLDQLSEEQMKVGYVPLLTSAFFEAIKRRFRGKKRRDIIDWVAEVRAQMDTGNRIDPEVAELLVLWVFGKASVDDLDFEVGSAHQAMLVTLLVEEEQLDEPGLDAFLQKARAEADAAMG